jgi:hypothetical protein
MPEYQISCDNPQRDNFYNLIFRLTHSIICDRQIFNKGCFFYLDSLSLHLGETQVIDKNF